MTLQDKKNAWLKSNSISPKEGFWDNPEETKPILKERTFISNKIEKFNKLAADLEENQILLDLAIEESDKETLAEVSQHAADLDQRIDEYIPGTDAGRRRRR